MKHTNLFDEIEVFEGDTFGKWIIRACLIAMSVFALNALYTTFIR